MQNTVACYPAHLATSHKVSIIQLIVSICSCLLRLYSPIRQSLYAFFEVNLLHFASASSILELEAQLVVKNSKRTKNTFINPQKSCRCSKIMNDRLPRSYSITYRPKLKVNIPYIGGRKTSRSTCFQYKRI